jgi:hypothetical protein
MRKKKNINQIGVVFQTVITILLTIAVFLLLLMFFMGSPGENGIVC